MSRPTPRIAQEATVFVEDREPGDGHIPPPAAGRRAGKLEIAERQMRGQRRTVPAPRLLVRLEVGHFPAGLAEFGALGQAR
jgi:hypothetical protein